MIKKCLTILPVLLLLVFQARADVAPDTGFTRINRDLILQTDKDLSDYEFFLDFHGDIVLAAIDNKSESIIKPKGGGARYRTGNLWAIPKKYLAEFNNETLLQRNEKVKNLISFSGQNEGVVKLLSHNFILDVPFYEQVSFSDSVYQIRREGNTLRAVEIKKYRIGTIVAGILIALGLIVTGVFLFRKVVKKFKIKL